MTTTATSPKVTMMTEATYKAHARDNDGFCTVCKAFTRNDYTEPDAEDYDCPDCEGNTVVGAENALVMGLIDFTAPRAPRERG